MNYEFLGNYKVEQYLTYCIFHKVSKMVFHNQNFQTPLHKDKFHNLNYLQKSLYIFYFLKVLKTAPFLLHFFHQNLLILNIYLFEQNLKNLDLKNKNYE